MKRVKVGFLGLGNVGSGVYRLLQDMQTELAHRVNLSFEIEKILVRDLSKLRSLDLPQGILTDRAEEVTHNPEITLIVECLGGEQPATEYMLAAMRQGKSIVTANKMALATYWPQLQEEAQRQGVGLYFEASAVAAVPVVASIQNSLQANRFDLLMGVINGTTNYILTQMASAGVSYADALEQAKVLGFAEPDPTADVEGYDAAYKLSILSSLAFQAHVPVSAVYREGISAINDMDIAYGKEMGLTLKLLAVAKQHGRRVETRVHPTFIPQDHPLASVSGSFNAVFLHGHACGDMMFYGRGAGDLPTASAVVSDMIRAAKAHVHRYPTFVNNEAASNEIDFEQNWISLFFVRLWAQDAPGVLSEVAGCFAAHGVSIASMIQRAERKEDGRVSLVFLTHEAREQDMRAALSSITPEVATVASMIRVEK